MLSEKPWKPELVLSLLLGLFICLFISASLSGLVQHFRPAGAKEPASTALLTGALSLHGLALIFIYRFVRQHQVSWTDGFGLRHRWPRALLLGAVVGCLFPVLAAGSQYVVALGLERLGYHPEEQAAVQALRAAGSWPLQVVMGGITILLAPAVEELFFRGVLYPTIKQAGFPRLAWWGSSLAFAAIHFHLPSFLALFLLAMTLIWLYEKTDNLLAPIAAHSLFNTVNFVMLHFGDKPDQLLPPHP